MKPDVAAFGPIDGFPGVADNQVGGHRRAFGEGLVDDGLEAKSLGTALHAVTGDHTYRSGVLNAVGKAAGGEARENHAVHRTDTGAGEHRDGQFGHHGQIEGHPVALLDTARLEHIGKAADPVQQVGIGDGNGWFRGVIGLPKNGGALTVPPVNVPVEAVGGDVELGTVKPAYPRRIELPFANGVPGGHPIVMAGDVRPKGIGIGSSILAGGRNGPG